VVAQAGGCEGSLLYSLLYLIECGPCLHITGLTCVSGAGAAESVAHEWLLYVGANDGWGEKRRG
jgi:hypothetical protein